MDIEKLLIQFDAKTLTMDTIKLTEDQRKMIPLLIEAAMLCGSVMAGPAPNSGDGIPDGPGWGIVVPHPGLDNEGPGPAPNAGDGIPDGSGF